MMTIGIFSFTDNTAKLLLAAALVMIAAGVCCIICYAAPKKKRNAGGGAVSISFASVIGSRDSQQDYVLTPQTYGIPEELRRERGELVVLCDGMGGMRGGANASQTCCKAMMESYYGGARADPNEYFQYAIRRADRAVAALTDESGRPMRAGTTLLAVIVRDGLVYWASVGDSRIYRIKNRSMELLTRDHNYLMTLMERVRRGEMSEETALNDPNREALISYIGGGNVELMDICALGQELERNEVILMCSDGLYRSMSNDEISRIILRSGEDREKIAEALVSEALAKRWIRHDNISVAVICRSNKTNKKHKKRRKK